MFYNHENFYPQTGKHLLNIGLIPDGARRWAKINDISFRKSYKISMDKIYSMLDYLLGEKNIGSIVTYFSSVQNFRRTNDEISMFCEAQNDFLTEYIIDIIEKHDVDIEFSSNLDIIPSYLYETILKLKEIKSKKKEKTLYFCIAYDPIKELYNAFSRANDISNFPKNLEVPIPIDFIIRTGGANLLSNFLPVQSGYARLYTVEKLFNDLSFSDIDEIIETFSKTQLKYGE